MAVFNFVPGGHTIGSHLLVAWFNLVPAGHVIESQFLVRLFHVVPAGQLMHCLVAVTKYGRSVGHFSQTLAMALRMGVGSEQLPSVSLIKQSVPLEMYPTLQIHLAWAGSQYEFTLH